MKTLKSLLLACCVLSFCIGYAQNEKSSPLIRYAKENVYAVPTDEEAKSMLKDSYHYMYFRNPTDSVANLNRFIATINRIVPLSPGKERIIREQAMAAVRQQTEKLPLSDQMFNLIYSIDEHITLMGTNVIEVIRNNFDEADFTLIYGTMEREMRWAIYACSQLEMRQIQARQRSMGKTRASETLSGRSRKEALDSVFEEYNIE